MDGNFARYGTARNDGDQPLKLKPDEFIHIPISEVLKKWMSNGSFGCIVDLKKRRPDGVLASYADGLQFCNHPYRLRRPNSVLVKGYYDEVDVCDSAGSKASGEQKLGNIYTMIEDMSPAFSSQTKFINLTATVRDSTVRKYGMQRILKYIVDDFKKLENGVDLPNGNKLYGTISTLIGDNLAIHQCCGLKKSFTARHPCRYCMATLEQVRSMTKENVVLKRTSEEHDRQVTAVEVADGAEREEISTSFGVTERYVLNELSGFHVTTSTPPDITHDDLEGYVLVTVKCFLKEICLNLRLMTLLELNERIQNFDYGYSEKSSKPSPLKESHLTDNKQGFKQTASKIWQLVVILPLIVIRVVPEGLPQFQNYLKMLEILCISFADEIPIRALNYLGCSISEYLEGFKEIYRLILTPKQHFLTYRPELILKFGPLIQYSTMRPESKHQWFKRYAQSMRTYKNLPLTLARKHQLFQAAIMRETMGRKIETGSKKIVYAPVLAFSQLFPNERNLITIPWVKINCVKYISTKCFLALGLSEDSLPQFASLRTIIIVNRIPSFVCKKVSTIQNDTSVMGYEVEINDDFVNVRLEDVFSHEVFHSHRFGAKKMIIVKKSLGNLH